MRSRRRSRFLTLPPSFPDEEEEKRDGEDADAVRHGGEPVEVLRDVEDDEDEEDEEGSHEDDDVGGQVPGSSKASTEVPSAINSRKRYG